MTFITTAKGFYDYVDQPTVSIEDIAHSLSMQLSKRFCGARMPPDPVEYLDEGGRITRTHWCWSTPRRKPASETRGENLLGPLPSARLRKVRKRKRTMTMTAPSVMTLFTVCSASGYIGCSREEATYITLAEAEEHIADLVENGWDASDLCVETAVVAAGSFALPPWALLQHAIEALLVTT